jgi:hypothetical protein
VNPKTEKQSKEPLVRSRKSAAIELGICVRSIDNLIKAGELKSVLIGRRRMIPTSALESFIRRKSR